MLGIGWECHKVREFALRPMGDFLLVLDHMPDLFVLKWSSVYRVTT